MRLGNLTRDCLRRKRVLSLAGLLVSLVLSGSTSCQSPDSGVGEEASGNGLSPAPAFDLADLDGSRHRLGDYAGRVVLVEFWATWCGPCRLQAEILSRLYEEVGGDDVEFLAVSLGEPEDIVRKFTGKDPFPYPVLLDTDETLGFALEIYALPTVMIVDRNGDISFFRPGISDGETLRRALEAAAGDPQQLASSS
jgi:thiol-disulfide isomerase/thioredoxin